MRMFLRSSYKLAQYSLSERKAVRAFPWMHRVVAPAVAESEGWKIDVFQVSAAESSRTALRAHAHGDALLYIPPGTYARLYMGGVIMMSDTPMERITCYPMLRAAHGDVLVLGAGIGVLTAALMHDTAVRSITVVDNKPDLLRHVDGYLKGAYPKHVAKLKHQHGDAFQPEFAKGSFDTVIADIWPTVSLSNVPEVRALRSAYKSILRKSKLSRFLYWGSPQLREMQSVDDCLGPVGGHALRAIS